jgi:hypothetical protein
MTKKIMIFLICLMVATAGLAIAADLQGTIKDIKDNTVTIEINKGKTGDLSVGDLVEVKADGKKAPKKGGDMLQGC